MKRKINITFKIFIIMFIIISIDNISCGDYLNISNEEYQKRLERARQISNSIAATSSDKTYSNNYVFITENSAKYHKAGCDYLER